MGGVISPMMTRVVKTLSYSTRSASYWPSPMRQQGIAVPVLTLALFIAAMGCRSSTKTGAPAPKASPTPAAQAQQSAQPPATPNQSVLVSPIQVTPPATFGADQLPQDGDVAFRVTGNAGQVLLVKLSEAEIDPYRGVASVRVQPPDASSPQLAGGGDYSNRLFTLPQTGAYQVLFSPEGYRQTIQFRLLAGNDPMVDPGINAKEISVDFGSFARKNELGLVPYSNPEGDEGDYWPSHLGVDKSRFEFRIMPVTGYESIFKQGQSMEHPEAALQRHGKDADVRELPYPYYKVGLNFSTRPQFVEGEGWRGLRWLASYGQDIGCWFDDSAYVLEGISNDGRFFILMRAAVSNPPLARRLAQQCKNRGRENTSQR